MDLTLFPQAIAALNSPQNQEAFVNANQYLTLLFNNDPFSFGQATLDLLFSTNEIIYIDQCCVLFRRFSSTYSKTLSAEQLGLLFQRLSQNFLNLCSNIKIQPHFKSLIANSMAFIGSSFFLITQETASQEFLVSFLQGNPAFFEYTLTAISDMITLIPNQLCFPFDFISQIISNVTTLSQPILSLFFATASCDITNEALQPLFSHIMELSSPETLKFLLQNLLDFSEKYSLFFAPRIGEFTTAIGELAADPSNPFRVLAILLLASLAENAPEMCSQQPFLEPAVTSLISILSEVDDNTPWDFDPNDDNPSTVARQAISEIFAAVSQHESSLVLSCIMAYHSLVFEQESTPEQKYAVLTAISEMKTLVLKQEDENFYRQLSCELEKQGNIAERNAINEILKMGDFNYDLVDPTAHNPTSTFYTPILEILFDSDQGQTRLRCAAYDVISQASIHTISMLKFFPQLFQLTFSETTPFMQLKAIKALRSIICHIHSNELIQNYASYFEGIIQLTAEAAPEIKPHLIILLGQYAKNLGTNLNEMFGQLLMFVASQFQIKYDNQTLDIANKIAVVTATGLLCANKSESLWIPDLAEYLNGLLLYGLGFIHSEHTSNEININDYISFSNNLTDIESSLISLIKFIGRSVVLSEDIYVILRKTIESYINTIPPISPNVNLEMEGLAAFEKVPSLDKTNHFYVTKSEVQPYVCGLHLLNSMLEALSLHFEDDEARCMDIPSVEYLKLAKIILLDYGAVLSIRTPAWGILMSLQNWVIHQNLTKNYIQIFSASLVKGIKEMSIYSDKYNELLLTYCIYFIDFVGNDGIPIEDPALQEFLQLLGDLLNYIVNSTQEFWHKNQLFNRYDNESTWFYSRYNNVEQFLS